MYNNSHDFLFFLNFVFFTNLNFALKSESHSQTVSFGLSGMSLGGLPRGASTKEMTGKERRRKASRLHITAPRPATSIRPQDNEARVSELVGTDAFRVHSYSLFLVYYRIVDTMVVYEKYVVRTYSTIGII